MRTSSPLLGSFGWMVAGALALGLSFPPTSFYPLAWVALVPWIVRWRWATSPVAFARDVYAAALVWSCSAGFWLLFHPDPGRALLGGLGVLLVPLPLALAFVGALTVRLRFGLVAGLVALLANVVATEFAMLHLPGGVPWLLLGHTQATAVPFIQTADLGGVLLISAWVLGLNIIGSLAIAQWSPSRSGAAPAETRAGERGVAVGLFALLIVLPVLYGAARAAQPGVPVGYTRLGLVQPGVAPDVWDQQAPGERIESLAALSSTLLDRWRGGQDLMPDTLADTAIVGGFAATRSGSLGMLVWPQAALPDLGSDEHGERLLRRLGQWCSREGVDLLAGGTFAQPSAPALHAASASDPISGLAEEEDAPRRIGSAALLVRAGRPTVRYDQMRRLPLADSGAPRGQSRILFPTGGARLATTLGFESVYGDHVRTFAREGADAFVVLAQTDWWGRGGSAQHLAFTRLRAVETRRAIVVSAVGGGSSLVTPTGDVETLAGWMQPALIPLDVPLYREATIYATHGDWLGSLALWLALLGNGFLLLIARLRPRLPAPPPRRPLTV